MPRRRRRGRFNIGKWAKQHPRKMAEARRKGRRSHPGRSRGIQGRLGLIRAFQRACKAFYGD